MVARRALPPRASSHVASPKKPTRVRTLRPSNTFQIRRKDMVVGTDGQPQGPQPHVHILPCPYDTRPWQGDSSYSRGERGEDAGGVGPCGRPSDV